MYKFFKRSLIKIAYLALAILLTSSYLPAKAAHTAFELDADQSEAVVYGGTGR